MSEMYSATDHIELLPQDTPFLQCGGGLRDNRVLQWHHRLAQPKGRKTRTVHEYECTEENTQILALSTGLKLNF